MNVQGCLAMESGDYTTALNYFNQGLACEELTNEQELLRNRIACYEYLGDYDSAKTEVQSYLTRWPGDAEVTRESMFILSR